MNKRKLMIMGAGIYQVPLIEKAKEMGLETVVISIEGNYPGIPLADRFYAVDTRDYEAVLEIAKKEYVSGICTSGTDVAIKTIGYVNDKMGLSGISYEAACKVTDKAVMKEVFQDGEVSTAEFEKVYSLEEAHMAAEKIGYPVVIKAVDSSGSRGIQKVDNDKELPEAYKNSAAITKKEYVLVEKFIDAEEIGVDGFVGEDGAAIILPHKKFTYTVSGVTIPSGHAFPYEDTEEQIKEIENQMQKAISVLGLKNCPFNADVFVKENKAWIIEIGGRTGATCIPELITIFKGYDWYEKIICAALGENVTFDSPLEIPCMSRLLFSEHSGVISDIRESVIEEVKKDGLAVHLDYQLGDRVDAVRNGTDRIGHVIGKEITEEQMEGYVQRIGEAIVL